MTGMINPDASPIVLLIPDRMPMKFGAKSIVLYVYPPIIATSTIATAAVIKAMDRYFWSELNWATPKNAIAGMIVPGTAG